MGILVLSGVVVAFGVAGGFFWSRVLGQPFLKCAVTSAILIGGGFLVGWFLGGLFGGAGRGGGGIAGVAMAGVVESLILKPKR